MKVGNGAYGYECRRKVDQSQDGDNPHGNGLSLAHNAESEHALREVFHDFGCLRLEMLQNLCHGQFAAQPAAPFLGFRGFEGHVTYHSLPVGGDTNKEFCSCDLHFQVIDHIIQLAGERDDIVSAVVRNWKISTVKQTLVVLEKSTEHFNVGFNDHYALVDLVLIVLYILYMFGLVLCPRVVAVSGTTDRKLCLLRDVGMLL